MKLTHLVVPALLVSASAFAQDVRYNFDKGGDFTKYKTYKWVQLKDAPKLDQLVEKQVRSVIEEQLATKGLTMTESENADLFVAFQITLSQEKEFSSYSSDFGYGAGWGRGWYGGGMGGTTMTTGQTSTIHIGALGLDMYDSSKKQLVWRGVASKTLDAKAKPDKRAKNLKKGVEKLLKNYPPPAK